MWLPAERSIESLISIAKAIAEAMYNRVGEQATAIVERPSRATHHEPALVKRHARMVFDSTARD